MKTIIPTQLNQEEPILSDDESEKVKDDDQPIKINSEILLQVIVNKYFNSQISKEELSKFVDLKFLNSYTKFINQSQSQLNAAKKKTKKLLLQSEDIPIRDTKISSSVSHHSRFTKKEDEMLKNYVSKLGAKNWRLISSLMPGRNQKQCRDRYINYLAPGLIRTEWTKEEDDLLIEKFQIYGTKWAQIRQFFPNRTSNDIKNRTNYTILPKLKNNETFKEIKNHSFPIDKNQNIKVDIFTKDNLIEPDIDQFCFDTDEFQYNDFFNFI